MDEPAAHPRFSVVVPCYNYGHFLPACVASVLDQDVEVEIVVVEDRSTDSSGEVADALAAQDGRVRVLHNEVNLGLIGTANRGLAEARGEFLVLLSADDLLAPGALARAERLFDADPAVGLVYGDVELFEDEVPPRRPDATPRWYVWPGRRWARIVARTADNPISSPEAIVRRDVLDAVGPYRAEFPHTSDLKYWLESAQHADVARIAGPVAAYYRRHGDNMSAVHFGEPLVDATERLRAFDSSDTGPTAWDARAARRAVAHHFLWMSLVLSGTSEDGRSEHYRTWATEIDSRRRFLVMCRVTDAFRPGHGPRLVPKVAPKLAGARWRVRRTLGRARWRLGARRVVRQPVTTPGGSASRPAAPAVDERRTARG
ncbi:hypothetical protein GCM10025864_26480 [Luteimicrobium album]|uniref:Glycosyltransferase 2-like domain-containing protein n=1 Tax=Luteimicrobium album TaxID=1054550 RepID=A0ABQ6I4Z0_9MICO|nr:glycosyltransferase [Luteimicrobium album]GMA24889.1 hypothetical protein GCM10025864_26480 [Luteimicrobium album]